MGTQPEIAAALKMISQFASSCREANWKAVKCIVHYLKGTIDVKGL